MQTLINSVLPVNNARVLLCSLGWIALGFINMYIAAVGVLLTFAVVMNAQRHYLLIGLYITLIIISDSRHPNLAFGTLIKPVIGLFIGIYGLLIYKKWNIKNPLIRYFAPFFIIAFVTSLLSMNAPSILKTLSYFFLVMSVPLVFMTAVVQEKDKMFKDLTMLIIMFLGVGIVARFIYPELVMLNGRYRGILGNPNGLGLFIMLTYFLIQIFISKRKELFNKQELLLFYGVFFLSLLLCRSRTAMLVIGIYHIFLYVNKKNPVFSFFLLILIAVSWGAIMSNIVAVVQFIGLEEYARVETIEEGSGRYIAWEFIWEKIQLSNFYFGSGTGATEAIFRKNYESLSKLGHQGNAHNSYLTFWYDLGLFGVLSVVFGYLMSFVNQRKDPAIFPILLGVLFSAFFESWLTASQNPFTIMVILIVTTFYYFSTKSNLLNEGPNSI